eukprot:CAMPEP_0172754594 /NCGR_PEP_ID=MMETSP1074-20121228/158228_1 /TAXON_ID=2916 /ORGANISM="Ceratium fusus, Strain PA161109" /LENGTH=177 /DNA_ID=CAMNT_0013587525 /DNA_START=10 /DNA_END=543 /DNA_ORIENTATION=+
MTISTIVMTPLVHHVLQHCPVSTQNGTSKIVMSLCTIVEHKKEAASDGREKIDTETLVQTPQAFFCSNLLEAVQGPFVDVIFDLPLSLHLQAAAYSVEGIRRRGTQQHCRLSCSESGHRTDNALVSSVRVQAGEAIKSTQLHASIDYGAGKARTEAGVQSEETTCTLHGFRDAIKEA